MEEKKTKMIRIIVILLLSSVSLSVFSQKVMIVNEKTGVRRVKEFPSSTNTILGLKDHVKVYFITKKDRPKYNNLTQTLKRNIRFTDSIADGNNYPYCVYEWDIVRLPDSTIQKNKIQAVRQKEEELFYKSKPDDYDKIISIAFAALVDDMNDSILTNKQKNAINEIYDIGSKAKENNIVKRQLIKNIKENPKTNIKQGWIE